MPPVRICYLLGALGFAMSSLASAFGAAPRWPNDLTWTVVGAIAAVALTAYALHPTLQLLSLATSTVVVASVARIIGWVYSSPRWESKLSAGGVWLIVAALMFVIHHKARRVRRQ